MKTLYTTTAVCIVLAAIIPIAPSLAVSHLSPLTSHFLYMFAHANILHWAINSWALLVLHNTFRWYRLITAYILAVALSFLPHVSFVAGAASAEHPVMGASVITTFFFGLITPALWPHNKTAVLMMIALLLISCFLPGFAAVFHIIPFIAGVIFIFIERTIRSYIHFIK